MKKIPTILVAMILLLLSGSSFAQVKSKAPTRMLLALPPEDDPGGGGGGGGGPPPVYGQYIPGEDDTATGPGKIELWEANYGGPDIIWRDFFAQYDVKSYSFTGSYQHIVIDGVYTQTNDEARSATFYGVKAGTTFEFYNSPSGSKSDDYTIVEFKTDIPYLSHYLLFTFENSYEDNYVKVTAIDHGQIDGKISYYKQY